MDKRKSVVIAILLMLVGAPLAADNQPELVRTVFEVEGMHCDGCSTAIVASLEKLDGVVEATADHEAGRAEAVYSPRKVSVDELAGEIEKLGYSVTGSTTETAEG